ncbi:MAG: hypothetical protein WC285_05140 [Candidatus Gracilibacteria bacterium]|jgi:hypothetical protein
MGPEDDGQSGVERAEASELPEEIDGAVGLLEQEQDGGEIPLESLPSFAELGLSEEEIMEFLARDFKVPTPLRVMRTYVTQGEPDTDPYPIWWTL